MSKKEITVIILLGALTMFQVGFMAHVPLFPGKWLAWLNFVNLTVIVIALFEKRQNSLGWIAALWGGIFLDLFSARFFGFWMIALLFLVAFIKLVIKKYVRISSFW